MTESEWLTEQDLEYLLDKLEDVASSRKYRLFAVGCAWRNRHLLTDAGCRTAFDLAEGYADGLRTIEELSSVHQAAKVAMSVADRNAATRLDDRGVAYFASKPDALALDTANVAHMITQEELRSRQARDAADAVLGLVGHAAIPADLWGTAEGDVHCERAWLSELTALLQMAHDVFGNPFRPVSVNPAWLTPSVTELAQSIYDSCAFDRLPELADALHATGCDDADLLGHCRGGGDHMRGCWAVDLVLGKK